MTMLVESNLNEIRGAFSEKRVWIIGSGPSLDLFDLTKIPNTDTILALNAAITLFTDVRKYPNAWWVYRDIRVAHEVVEKLVKSQLPWRAWKIITHIRGWMALKDKNYWKRFSHRVHLFNINSFIHEKTVAEDALQIALVMGFKQAILVGVDCAVHDNRPYAKSLMWKECHFYNIQKPATESAACKTMARALESLKPKLSGHIEVLNTSPYCSPIFPKVVYDEAVKIPTR